MDETQRGNHCFEATAASGTLIYMIDSGAPVCLKFNSFVKIEVVFDAFSHFSKTEVAEDFDNVQGVLVTDQTEEPAAVDSVFLDDHQCTGQSHVHGNDLMAENSQEDMVHTSELVTTWEPKQREVKRAKAFGESDSLAFPKKVKKNNRLMVQQKSCSKEKSENSEENEQFDEHVQEGGSVCSNVAGGRGSDLHNKVYNTKLRSSNRLVKLNTKSHTDVQASKAAKTLLKTTIRKSSNSSKKYLVKQTRSPAKELPEHSGRLSQVAERPRKLLMDKTVKCEYCAKDFHNQQAFYDHRRAEESTHKCGICGKVEPYEAHLIVHMQKHRRTKEGTQPHNPKSSNSKSQLAADFDNTSISVQKKSKKEKMKCNFCGLVVSSMDSLKIHTFLHTGEHAYRCCICGEHFSSLSSRQHHMDTHISAQRFKCNPCGERFISRAELAKHQLTHEIKCALCGEIFPNKTSRTCHFRVSHASDILKCSLCSNLFATVEDLQKHLTYHRKGKKEQCPVCGVVVSKLKDHMLMHSQGAQEKLYACDQCPMRYLRKSNLDRHIRTHTGEKPYACNKCPKSFRSNGMLRKHLLTHTKERPYQCEVCGKQCSLRSNLNIHMRVHNNDRYFCCPLCSQAFNHKNSLHGHMKNKHAQEGHLQDRPLNRSVHSVHQSEMPAPNVVTERDKSVTFDQKPFQNLAIPFISRNTDSGLLKIDKLDDIQDFRQMHSQLNFPMDKPGTMAADMLLLGDRYDVHTQGSHNHSY